MPKAPPPLLTLEPLIEAVQDGVSRAGWALSGLQKTTSHQFEGRWQGVSSRSAYLFFHSEQMPDFVSVDVFLDETSKGLQGNIALVVEGPELVSLGDARAALAAAAAAADERLPRGYRTPIALRLRLADSGSAVESATVELRVKVRIPDAAIRSGHGAVAELAAVSVRAFERLLEHPELRRYTAPD